MLSRKSRLAAIDVGTNSIHMIIVEAARSGYRVIDKEKEMVQLGSGSLGGNPLTEAAMQRGVAALESMAEIARRSDVAEIVAVATSAVREAPNRRRFLRAVEKSSGIKVRVISGEEEADYIYRAVRAAVDFQGGTSLCIDIGGGSVEMIAGTDREVFFTSSSPIGSLRLAQKFWRSDPPSSAEMQACRRYVARALKKSLVTIDKLGFDFTIGTSGTILALAEMGGGEPTATEGVASGLRWLETKKLEALIEQMASVTAAERVQKFAVDSKRSESILAGAIVLREILAALRIKKIRACTAALREGIVERMLEEKRRDPGSERNVRRTSVLELAERGKYDETHATHVAHLALRIFDQTAKAHELRPADRDLIEYAALLHEIGVHVSYQKHHKHTYYLIRHSGLRGFTEDQVSIIANVARYYRKATPEDHHPNLDELTGRQRETVRKLSAILRVADALDRSRKRAVRDVGVDVTKDKVKFFVRARLDPAVEIKAAQKRSKYMAAVFDRDVEFAESEQ